MLMGGAGGRYLRCRLPSARASRQRQAPSVLGTGRAAAPFAQASCQNTTCLPGGRHCTSKTQIQHLRFDRCTLHRTCVSLWPPLLMMRAPDGLAWPGRACGAAVCRPDDDCGSRGVYVYVACLLLRRTRLCGSRLRGAACHPPAAAPPCTNCTVLSPLGEENPHTMRERGARLGVDVDVVSTMFWKWLCRGASYSHLTTQEPHSFPGFNVRGRWAGAGGIRRTGGMQHCRSEAQAAQNVHVMHGCGVVGGGDACGVT